MTVFNIKVYYDTICPWCYIGDRVFLEAMALYQKTYPDASRDSFRYTFYPYFLDANLPVPGIPMEERIAAKNGSEMARGIKTRLQRVGRRHGLNFVFQGKIGNTRDSHRLLQYAGKKDPEVQKALLDAIFHALFESDMDVSSHADLAKAAGTVGLSTDNVLAFLQTSEFAEEVDAMAAESRANGVKFVPTVEIGNVRIEGAEDVSTIYEALIQAKTGLEMDRQ